VNTSDLSAAPLRAERRVLEIQTKLHRWANDDPHRRFDDLYNLVTDPDVLLMAWERVAGNRGARSAGVDGKTAAFVEERIGVERFLAELRQQLRCRSFRPLPVRERMIPKPGSRKRRRLGIPTVAAKCRVPPQLFESGADRSPVSCAGWSPRSGVVRQAAWP
jgi:RNA-directed DNA polymerase